MTSKTVRVIMSLVIGAALLGAVFSVGFGFGLALPILRDAGLPTESTPLINPTSVEEDAPTEAPESSPTSTPVFEPSDREELMAPFWHAWEILHDQYVDQPLDDIQLMRGAIRGMVDSLGDAHTSYMNPDEYLQANLPLEGEYEGIGAWVDTEGDYLTIISPMPDSPAEKAGLKPGDEVIAVDGEDVTGMDPNLVIRKVLGPAGTEVSLTIHREGSAEPLDFTITRSKITIPSLESEMLESGIGYIRLYNFSAQVPADLRTALEELRSKKPLGLILDLRGNGGGFLNSAVEVASEFIPDGIILIERFGDGEEEIHRAIQGGIASEIPMVVLIDAGSASASEIVAGALQDHDRALLIGETSFGKGSVQNWVPLQNNQGAVRVTIARWYTPDDRQIHEVGLEPDIEVVLTEEDIEADRDPQLDRAEEELLQGGSLD